MKTTNKTSIAIAFVLALTIAASSLTFLPITSAADYENVAYITVEPNPVGVGQEVTAIFFLVMPSPIAQAGFDPAYNWANFTVKITSPSGKIENFGPYTSDATGGAYLSYTPNEVGEYKFDFNFPGQTLSGLNYHGIPVGPYTYGPESATTNLTVQENPVKSYETPALPTDYWTRSIYGENKNWYQISGNWLQSSYNSTGPFNPYTTAPNTAHIVWTKKQYMAGVVGGDYGDLTYYQGPIYQNYFVPPIIIDGRLYYLEREVPGDAFIGMHCVDIRTGNELWFQDASIVGGGGEGGALGNSIYGQIFDAEGANGHGAEAFFWNLAANWTQFDANSGKSICTITNLPVATGVFSDLPGLSGPVRFMGGLDSMGSIITYYLDPINHWLLKWNSTTAIITAKPMSWAASPNMTMAEDAYLPNYGMTIDWKLGIEWNVSIPARPGNPAFYMGIPASDGNVLFAVSADMLNPTDNITVVAYSAKDGHELWYSDFADVFPRGSTLYQFFGPVSNGVLTIFDKNTQRWWGYDENTGTKLWGPTKSYGEAWDSFTTTTAAYGNLYQGTYGGHIYCRSLKTGDLLWTYTLPPSGYDTPYGSYPINGISIADGKIYAVTGEHTPSSPYWLGGAMYCVNATTGDGIFKMSGWWSSYPAIADGYALDENCYDGTIYCFGKGQTATTVSASPKVSVSGNSVLIEGTVMDESPGIMDYAGNRLNTKGTPAIADAYMTQWMEYLYQQKSMPSNATGVPVLLDVIDANGNYRNIGTATSDANGGFSYAWKPDIPGTYTVYATFAGSESYYSSFAETAFLVDEAPAATAEPTPAPQSAADMYFIPVSIGIIIAIIIVGALVILMPRKRQ